MPTLCETFRKQAGAVWNNMSVAAAKGLWLSEETLTEWVQYNIALTHQGKDFVVELATKPKEAGHGGDWEWWFAHGRKGIGFRVQAKRLFRPSQYDSLLKGKTTPYEQLDKLVKRAIKDDRVPLYCFYNFRHTPSEFAGMANTCVHTYRQPSFWGCSVAFPEAIKNAQSNKLSDLKAHMRPWHTLVCESDGVDVASAVRDFVNANRESHPVSLRQLPDHIVRLISFGNERRGTSSDRYIGEAWSSLGEAADEDLSGVVVYRDTRD